jgi:hypothetical protein
LSNPYPTFSRAMKTPWGLYCHMSHSVL